MAKKSEMTWTEAIIKVLEEEGAPMHYVDIAHRIIDEDYRDVSNNATPHFTVSSVITRDINEKAEKSFFKKVLEATYTLNTPHSVLQTNETSGKSKSDNASKFIKAFGMYWSRDNVTWKPTPQIWGYQYVKSKK